MGTLHARGFTIVETMLFLGISGLLIVAMLASTGVTINIQRYRDAVETFKSTLQNQYAELSSVQNERNNNWTCNALAESVIGGTEIRGQSDCVLLGRYLTVVDNEISINSVLGKPVAALSTDGTDIDNLLHDYTMNISTVLENKSTLEWDTRIAWPKSGAGSRTPTTPRSLAVLFIRSPHSGQIYTFTSDSVPNEVTPQSLADMLITTPTVPGQSGRTICIDSNGLFVTADFSVYLNPYATGPTSVETRSNDFVQSIGGDTRC